jgi:hypothetical protein
MSKIQTLPNVKGAYQNFEALKDKIEIDPNFMDVNCILVSNKVKNMLRNLLILISCSFFKMTKF